MEFGTPQRTAGRTFGGLCDELRASANSTCGGLMFVVYHAVSTTPGEGMEPHAERIREIALACMPQAIHNASESGNAKSLLMVHRDERLPLWVRGLMAQGLAVAVENAADKGRVDEIVEVLKAENAPQPAMWRAQTVLPRTIDKAVENGHPEQLLRAMDAGDVAPEHVKIWARSMLRTALENARQKGHQIPTYDLHRITKELSGNGKKGGWSETELFENAGKPGPAVQDNATVLAPQPGDAHGRPRRVREDPPLTYSLGEVIRKSGCVQDDAPLTRSLGDMLSRSPQVQRLQRELTTGDRGTQGVGRNRGTKIPSR
jgi:hypothetical protein